MAMHRFFLTAPLPRATDGSPLLPAEEPVELPLTAADVHHARDVARLGVDELIAVVEPDRSAWVVRITALGDVLEGLPVGVLAAPLEPHVTLVQGLAKGDKLDLIVEKTVELGIEAVVPVAFERSIVRLDDDRAAKRGERLRRLAAAAAKQAQRTYVPHVSDPQPASLLLRVLADFDIVLLAWEDAEGAPGVGDALAAAHASRDSHVAIVVGPEGGLSDSEVAALVGAGAHVVTLGEFVLRTETAGIVAAALCIYELGGLGGSEGHGASGD
ncbi:MAG: RsmE family RNA methyltransferase [Coriobacteriia bacterium]